MRIKVLRKTTVCGILMIAHTVSFTQVNLVSNPSFEIIYSCPSGANQLDTAVGWSTPINGGGILNFFIPVALFHLYVEFL